MTKLNLRTKKLVISAMMIAIGIVLPFFTGQIPEIGNMLLPMHIPVFLTGLLTGGAYGAAVGFILPLLRSVLFSAPPLFPNAFAMAFELLSYGAAVGVIYKLLRRRDLISLYISLVCSMLIGRGVWGLVMTMILGVGDNGFAFKTFISSAFVSAFLGIIIQLVLIPALMLSIGETSVYSKSKTGNAGKKARLAADTIFKKAEEIKKAKGRCIVAIDGRCASGKSTLAAYLEKKYAITVIHADDFFLPPEKRTAERLSIPGENIDHERFLREVLIPIFDTGEAAFRPFDCKTLSYGDEIRITKSPIYVVEGVYSSHRELLPYYDLTVFISVDKETQLKRLERRSSKRIFERFKSEWIPLEEKYFEKYKIEQISNLKFEI